MVENHLSLPLRSLNSSKQAMVLRSCTLPKFNSEFATEKLPGPNILERLVFQPPFFRGELLNFRGCKCKLPGSHNGKMFCDSAGRALEVHIYELVKVQKCTLQGKVYSHLEGG